MVGIALRVGGGGQRCVNLALLLRRRRPVDRRAHQRIAKPHAGADLQQPGRLRRLEHGAGDPQLLGGTPHERRVAGRLGRRHQHEASRALGQGVEPLNGALLDATRQRRGRRGEAARQLRRRQPARQLQQRQRIAPRLGHDPVAHPFIQRTRDDRAQQLPRVAFPEAFDPQLRQRPQTLLDLPDGEQHRHRLRLQPPRHEPQHLRRRAIQPLDIVHHAQHRALVRGLRQQAQHRKADEEPIRDRSRSQPERGRQRIALRAGKPIEPIQDRPTQLMQRRERELDLRLEPDRAQDPQIRCRPDRVLEQRRLPDPRLAGDHQRGTAPAPYRHQLPIQRCTLRPAPQQPRGPLGSGPHVPLDRHREAAADVSGMWRRRKVGMT